MDLATETAAEMRHDGAEARTAGVTCKAPPELPQQSRATTAVQSHHRSPEPGGPKLMTLKPGWRMPTGPSWCWKGAGCQATWPPAVSSVPGQVRCWPPSPNSSNPDVHFPVYVTSCRTARGVCTHTAIIGSHSWVRMVWVSQVQEKQSQWPYLVEGPHGTAPGLLHGSSPPPLNRAWRPLIGSRGSDHSNKMHPDTRILGVWKSSVVDDCRWAVFLQFYCRQWRSWGCLGIYNNNNNNNKFFQDAICIEFLDLLFMRIVFLASASASRRNGQFELIIDVQPSMQGEADLEMWQSKNKHSNLVITSQNVWIGFQWQIVST